MSNTICPCGINRSDCTYHAAPSAPTDRLTIGGVTIASTSAPATLAAVESGAVKAYLTDLGADEWHEWAERVPHLRCHRHLSLARPNPALSLEAFLLNSQGVFHASFDPDVVRDTVAGLSARGYEVSRCMRFHKGLDGWSTFLTVTKRPA